MIEHSKLTAEEKEKLINLAFAYGYANLELGITSHIKFKNIHDEAILKMHEARGKLIDFIKEC